MMGLTYKIPVAVFLLSFIATSPILCAAATGGPQTDKGQRRPVTVADAITMTEFEDPNYNVGRLGGPVAQFSPDGRRFVILVRRGDLERNANKYSLLLFK